MIKQKTISTKESGQSLTEFTLGMMFMFILVAGIVDTGRALFTYLSLRDAAQEGALYGSTDPDVGTIINRVCNSSNFMQSVPCSGSSGSDIYVDVQIPASACRGDIVRVRVSYDQFPITTPFLGGVIGRQTIGISSEIADMILSPEC